MPRMRHSILMIAPTSFFADYGCHVRIWEEAKTLQKFGHQLTIATYHNGDDMPGLDIRRSWDVPWLKRAMVGSSRHKIYLDAALSWRSLRTMLALRPTIIHAHLHEGALIGAVLRRMTRAPLVFDYQGSMTAEMLDHGFIQRASRMFAPLTRLEDWINRQADVLMTSTHSSAEQLRAQGHLPLERIHSVTDSVDTDRFQPPDRSPAWEAERDALRAQLGVPAGRRVVAYIGLLAPYQGTNILIEAARSVVEARPDTHFLIMGYPDPGSYRRYAESLGIGEYVTLPGRILYRDLHTYLALGDVAVAPKMSATEGSGKIPNYMAMGLPTITFDTPVSREYLGDSGIYAAFGSAADLAAKIIWSLDHPERAEQLGAQGRAIALRDLSWERSARQIERLYSEALERRASARAARRING
jgi:glycosyltransferase involved in cell wall biosynthesis